MVTLLANTIQYAISVAEMLMYKNKHGLSVCYLIIERLLRIPLKKPTKAKWVNVSNGN